MGHQPTKYATGWAKVDESYATTQWSRPSVTRLLCMLLSPAHLRLQLMNLRAYKSQLLRSIGTNPATFLTGSDLNSGKEMVFTSSFVSDLGPLGSRELWDQRPEISTHSSDNIENAQAVCAGSTFPPLFHSVAISNRHGLIGVFADGGLLDNAALNVPKAFSVHIHEQRDRYREHILPFREGISHQQLEAVHLDVLNLARNAGVDAAFMGLPVGSVSIQNKGDVSDLGDGTQRRTRRSREAKFGQFPPPAICI